MKTLLDALLLPPGYDLDYIVAEKIMGQRMLTVEEMTAEADEVWKKQPNCRIFRSGFEARGFDWGWGFKNIVASYSTKIEEAWRVFEWFRQRPGRGWAGIAPNQKDACHESAQDSWMVFDSGSLTKIRYGVGATPAHAICRAALTDLEVPR